MINEFIKNLNENNIIARIAGGQCYKKYFDENENTIDIDIHIYISYKQLKNKKTFEIIYNCIKNIIRLIIQAIIFILYVTLIQIIILLMKFLIN